MNEPLTPPRRSGAEYCFVCGPENTQGLHLQFFRLDDDAVYTKFTPPAEWSGWKGLMHGGLQCVLLDEITAWALNGLRDRPHFFTSGLEVRYRKPVRLDQEITLVGRITSETNRGSRVLGQILNEAGEVLSEANARIVHVDADRFKKIVESAP